LLRRNTWIERLKGLLANVVSKKKTSLAIPIGTLKTEKVDKKACKANSLCKRIIVWKK
jgi:hypothetical protein